MKVVAALIASATTAAAFAPATFGVRCTLIVSRSDKFSNFGVDGSVPINNITRWRKSKVFLRSATEDAILVFLTQ
jgi:hypothetical protein